MYKKILILTKLIYEHPRRNHEHPREPRAIFLKTTN